MKNSEKNIDDFKCENKDFMVEKINPIYMQSLVLALVGDSVESLYFRSFYANNTDLKVNAITKKINNIVNAHSQAESLRLIETEFNNTEMQVAKRARNTHTHSTAKNYSVIDYRNATALEAVLGFLYLDNQRDRLNYFLDKIRSKFIDN